MKIKLLILSVLLMFSHVSNARCYQYDITGFWKTYSFNTFGEVYECKLFLSGNGSVVTTRSSCFAVNLSNDTGTLPITGGRVSISGNCDLSGYIDINATRNIIRKGSLGTSMDFATGIVSFNSNGFGNSIFTMVRDRN